MVLLLSTLNNYSVCLNHRSVTSPIQKRPKKNSELVLFIE